MMRSLLAAAFLLVACNTKPAATVHEPAAPPSAAAVAAPADTHVHDVACGCSLGLPCQNMISVDGKFMPLTGPGTAKLPDMAFCGKKGLTATAEGKVEGGKFVASQFELLPEPPQGH